MATASRFGSIKYKYGVENSKVIWFQPDPIEWAALGASRVDVHLRIESDQSNTVRMKWSNVMSRYEYELSAPASKNIEYWFTFVGLPAYDTPQYGLESSPPPFPDFGPQVVIFESPAADVQSKIQEVFERHMSDAKAQFGEQRYVFLLKPSQNEYNIIPKEYTMDQIPGSRDWVTKKMAANVGFYTTVAGLGLQPDDVTVKGGLMADWGAVVGDEKNVTQNFWRSVENLAIRPIFDCNGHKFTRWAVSQAAPLRRVHICGDLFLYPSNVANNDGGWASGGYMADCHIDGCLDYGSQQQWFSRDCMVNGCCHGNWNNVSAGVVGIDSCACNWTPFTVIDQTPRSSGKPFLYFAEGEWGVFVPKVLPNTKGGNWSTTPSDGERISLRKFFLAKPEHSAQRINDELKTSHVLFTPGIYNLDQEIRVSRPGTIVLGLGFPTLKPVRAGVNAMSVADVDGVRIASMLFDAGPSSKALLTIGDTSTESKNCVVAQDLFFRVGGTGPCFVEKAVVVNCPNTILDHMWVWRCDHGEPNTFGWDVAKGEVGVEVNGNNVLATGLFVEHFRKQEVIWNGENGQIIFFQNEMPYDVPSQIAWNPDPTKLGWPALKVADMVSKHQAWGLGSYCNFKVAGWQPGQPNPYGVHRADCAFEVPDKPEVQLNHLVTVGLTMDPVNNPVGFIDHIVNNAGPTTETATTRKYMASYCNKRVVN